MMNKHCKASCRDIGICHTCGLVQDGNQTECILERYETINEWNNLADKLIFGALCLVAGYAFGKAFGQW